jgi:hypothetical protein
MYDTIIIRKMEDGRRNGRNMTIKVKLQFTIGDVQKINYDIYN